MKKILIIASNPRKDLNLDREIRDLKGVIKRSRNKAQFDMEIELAVRPDDLQELFLENEPRIVHFCGHGTGEQGLVLENDAGREQLVSTNALSSLFEFFDNKVECVLLNACYSDVQASAIIQHINYVVGMSQEIRDDAAIAFATGFYRGLGYGKSIEESYKLGCNAIQLQIDNNVTSRSRSDEASRKLGAVNSVEQVLIPEHLKPRLKKKQHLTPFVESDSSTQPNIPPESIEALKEAVKEEVARKEYKDQVREAYDNFGQFSAANVTSLTKHEYKQRKIVLSKVKKFWVEGFLKPSLQGNSAISLDLKARPDVLSDLSHSIEALSVELDESFEELQTTRIYEEMGQGRTLLILGNPGAGKTIALLQLAQRLVERSEQDLCLPIPVVFNLSSWGKDRKPIVDWLIDEMREKYQVPKTLSEPWITQWQLILLLDGLDEVKPDYRNDCVRALNEFIGLFPHTEMAVCSRVRDYEALIEHLQISSAICIQPLSSKQVYQFLDSVGGSLTSLKTLLKTDAELEQFAKTPLILNMMSSAYQGWSAEKLMQQLRSTPDRYQQHLFDTYIERSLHRGASSEYSTDLVLDWLSWLATQMVQEKQTVFLIEKMQPTWLQNRSERKVYQIRNCIILGLVLGLGVKCADFGAVYCADFGAGFGADFWSDCCAD
jgi:DNA polymerase III delta prime subunit